MTLLEILVALTIIVGLMGMSVSFLKRGENQTKATFRKLLALNRQLDSFSRLKGEVYRLVIDLDEKKNSWWVEKKQLIPEEGELPREDFVKDSHFYEEPQKLPGALRFTSVESEEQNQPTTQGRAYIYYFPEGQFSLNLLNIKGQKQQWSLLINRLRGNVTVFREKKKLEDFKQ